MTDATTRDDEPSMDDILSSIRRMISEDRGAATNGFVETPQRRAEDVAEEPASHGAGSAPQEVETDPLAKIGATKTAVEDAEDDAEESAESADASLIAEATAAATLASIQALSREVRVSAQSQGRTLEDIVETLLRPILKEWLDRHLPAIVNAKVEAEIRRIAERRGR